MEDFKLEASASHLIICATLAGAYSLAKLIQWRKRVQKLPPGPRKLPFIDNLFDMPTKLDSEVFEEMGYKYDTDIIHLGALGKSLLVLNSPEAARDLLFKRSGIYSGRAQSLMVEELCGWDFLFGIYPYGDKWREERRTLGRHMGVDGKIHYPNELYHTRKLLGSLLDNPTKFMDHFRHSAGAIFVSTAYGIRVRSEEDPYIRLIEQGGQHISDLAISGPFLPDISPAMKHLPSWIPGVQFKKIAAKQHAMARTVREAPFAAAQELIRTGESLPSLVSLGLLEIEQSGGDQASVEHLKNVAAQIYLAGADTVTSTLIASVLALVKFPEVQKKVHDELDNALQGIGKLPDHSEIMSLPYLTAFIMEVLRWKPVTPIGVPHATTADDIYRGYFIPKGTVVVANSRAMVNNPEHFPNPEQFNPDRFLKNGKINEELTSPTDIIFGFGRRICPGRHVALSTLMITVATMASNFQFTKQKDEKGRPIALTEGWSGGLARTPLAFKCEITPRSPEAVETIRAWQATESGGF